MKKILLSTTAMVAFSVAAAQAQEAGSLADRVIAALQAEGYESIELVNGPTQILVEAVRDGRKLEVIYDAETGAILEQSVDVVNDPEDHAPGVSIESDDSDFFENDDRDDDADDYDDEESDDADDYDDEESDDADDDDDEESDDSDDDDSSDDDDDD